MNADDGLDWFYTESDAMRRAAERGLPLADFEDSEGNINRATTGADTQEDACHDHRTTVSRF